MRNRVTTQPYTKIASFCPKLKARQDDPVGRGIEAISVISPCLLTPIAPISIGGASRPLGTGQKWQKTIKSTTGCVVTSQI